MFPYRLRPPGSKRDSKKTKSKKGEDNDSNKEKHNQPPKDIDNDDDNDNPDRYGGTLQRAIILDLSHVQKEFNIEMNKSISSHLIEQQLHNRQQKQQQHNQSHDDSTTTTIPFSYTYNHMKIGNIFHNVFKVVFTSNRVALLHRSNTISRGSTCTSKKQNNNDKDDDDESTKQQKDDDNNNNNNYDDDINFDEDDDDEKSDDDNSDDNNVNNVKTKKKKTTTKNMTKNKKKNSTNNNNNNNTSKSDNITCHLQPSNLIHVPSYTQLLYASCWFLLNDIMMMTKHNNSNNIDGMKSSNMIQVDHAFPIFCLFALYETNPLPAPPNIPFVSSSSTDNMKVSGTTNSMDTNTGSLLYNLPMGYTVNRENPKLFYRHIGKYRPPIRIDMKHYIYILQLYEMSNITIHDCHLMKIQYEVNEQQKRQHSNNNHNDNNNNISSWKCCCGIAYDLKHIITKIFTKQYTMLEFCSYTGPCSLEGYSGHSDQYDNMEKEDYIQNNTDSNNKNDEKDHIIMQNNDDDIDSNQETNNNNTDKLNQSLQTYLTCREQIRLPILMPSHSNNNNKTKTNNESTMSNNKIKRIRELLTPMFPSITTHNNNNTTEQKSNDQYTKQMLGVGGNHVLGEKFRKYITDSNNHDNDNDELINDTTILPHPILRLKQMMLKYNDNDDNIDNNSLIEQKLDDANQQEEKHTSNQKQHEVNNIKNKNKKKHHVSFGNVVTVHPNRINPSAEITNNNDRIIIDSSSHNTNDDNPSLTFEIRCPTTISKKKMNSMQRAIKTIIKRDPNRLLLLNSKHKKQLNQKSSSHVASNTPLIDTNDQISMSHDSDDINTNNDNNGHLRPTIISIDQNHDQVKTSTRDDNSTVVSTTSDLGRTALQTLFDQASVKTKPMTSKKENKIVIKRNKETSLLDDDGDTKMSNTSSVLYSTTATADDDNNTIATGVGRTALQTLLDQVAIDKKEKKKPTTMINAMKTTNKGDSNKEIFSREDDGTLMTSNSICSTTTADVADDNNTITTGIGRTALQTLLDHAAVDKKKKPLTIIKTKNNNTNSKGDDNKEIFPRDDDGTLMTSNSICSTTTAVADDNDTMTTGIGRTSLQTLLDHAASDKKKPPTMIKTKNKNINKGGSNKEKILSRDDGGTLMTSNSVCSTTTAAEDNNTVTTGIGRTALQTLLDHAVNEPKPIIQTKNDVSKRNKEAFSREDGTVATSNDDNTVLTGIGRTALQTLLGHAAKKPIPMIQTKNDTSKGNKNTFSRDDGTLTTRNIACLTTAATDDNSIVTGMGRTALQTLLDHAAKEPLTMIKTKHDTNNVGALFLDAMDDDDDNDDNGDDDNEIGLDMKLNARNITSAFLDMNMLRDDNDSVANFSDISYDGYDDYDNDNDEVSIAASRVGQSALHDLLDLAREPRKNKSSAGTRKEKRKIDSSQTQSKNKKIKSNKNDKGIHKKVSIASFMGKSENEQLKENDIDDNFWSNIPKEPL